MLHTGTNKPHRLPAVCATLLATSFIAPVNFGVKTTCPSIASGPHITNLKYAHDFATSIFNEYEQTNKELCQMLIAGVNKMFICSLRHRYVRYGTTTTRTIIDHLYATYAKISLANLLNNTRFRAPYDARLPIKALISQFKGAVKYASYGNTPYTPLQVFSIAYQLIF